MSTKTPKARINSIKSISKVYQLSKDYNAARADQDPATIHIHISGGNSKLGSIMNISLPPVVTCSNCGSCSKYCYAVRSYNRFTGTAAGWNENYLLFLTDPDRYFKEISDAVKLQRFFRWHVAGDIVNGLYFAGMIKVAIENPKVEFLAFTKAYQIVNAAIAAGIVIPSNLHLLFSASPGVEMPNPYNIPECHINFADPAQNTYCGGAEYEYHCTGNCTECAVNGCGCFFLKPGDVTIINQH
jgi:ferredoxin